MVCSMDLPIREDKGKSDQEIFRAISGGNPSEACRLLQNGANANARNENEGTPLHEAVWRDYLDVVRELLERSADVNAQDRFGDIPLHKAGCSSYGMVEIARRLLAKGADVNARNRNRETPLHEAARSGKVDVVKELLASAAVVNVWNENGETPLHEAARSGKVDVVRELLKRGADIDDLIGIQTPLAVAARYGKVEVVKELLAKGADVNKRKAGLATSLHLAVGSGRIGVVRELLARGADTNARDGAGKTPLERTSQEKREEITKIFAEHESKKCRLCLKPCKSNEQVTAFPCSHVFHSGCLNSEFKTGKSCSVCGEMPVNLDGRMLEDRLLLAAEWGDLGMLWMLLTQGANMNASNKVGHSVLFLASERGYADLVEALLVHAGSNKIQGLDQSLSVAVEKKHKTVVRVLLQHGALVDKNDPRRDILGDLLDGNALLLAVMLSDVDTVTRELEKERNTSTIQEALLLALAQGHVVVVERLVRYFVDKDMGECLEKNALKKVRILCARSQSDALAERYRHIERLLIAGSPMVLGMRSIPSTALPIPLAP